MVWDLRGALLKKGEFESARLADFEFRHRARTFRLLARALKLDEKELVRRAASTVPEELIDWLSGHHELSSDDFERLYRDCSSEARRQLITEIGDPTPHRLL